MVSNMNTETIRIAYAVSTRELEDEPLSATDNALNESHRGNLPYVYQMMVMHNELVESGVVDLPKVELAVVVYDDEEPSMRSFEDIPVPFVGVCSSRMLELRDQRNAVEEARGRENAEFLSLKAQYARERRRFEGEFLGVIQEAEVDLVLLDRLMVILGKVYLNEYLGNTLNSHPAILPDLPGDTPTLDAWKRARSGENSWTGVTAHFIDKGIDTGPPIYQRESTAITPEMSVEDVRRANYRSESGNFWDAVVTYLSNPDARELISLRREARQLNGDGDVARTLARQKAKELVGRHREAFDSHWSRKRGEGLGTGSYRYRAPFGRMNKPVDVPVRTRLNRPRRAMRA